MYRTHPTTTSNLAEKEAPNDEAKMQHLVVEHFDKHLVLSYLDIIQGRFGIVYEGPTDPFDYYYKHTT